MHMDARDAPMHYTAILMLHTRLSLHVVHHHQHFHQVPISPPTLSIIVHDHTSSHTLARFDPIQQPLTESTIDPLHSQAPTWESKAFRYDRRE
jgi:hypothetical protein